MFINFRDFKGKSEEAINKLLNDLKKFALPNIKNIKPEHLIMGYGETVCQLIDELVNQELYRRDFEFIPPVFPEDDPNEESAEDIEESATQDDQF